MQALGIDLELQSIMNELAVNQTINAALGIFLMFVAFSGIALLVWIWCRK